MTYKCNLCFKEFDSAPKRDGHYGGAHRRKLTEIKHGTQWGYEQHIRRGVSPCPACKESHRKAAKQWREKTGNG